MNKLLITGVGIVLIAGIGFGIVRYTHRVPVTATVATSTTPSIVVRDVSLSTSTSFYTINARYAYDSRDTQGLMKQFAEYKVNEKEAAWSASSTVYRDAQATFTKHPDMPVPHNEYDLTYVKYESPAKHTISYLYAMYDYAGGANGVTTLASFTFGPNGTIPIDSILDFDNGNDIALTKIMRDKLITALGQSANKKMIDQGLGLAYLKADGAFDAKKCKCDGFFFGSNFQNFFVTDLGITFGLDQEKVAAHSEGMPEVLFSWKELAPYIKANSLVSGS